MTTRNFFLTGLLALLALPVRAQAVLEDYVQEALAGNLALQQQQLDLAKATEALAEARGLFYPSLSLEARFSRADGGRTIDFPVGDLLNPVYSTLNQLLEAQGQPGPFPQIDNVTTPLLRDQEQETKFRVVQPLYQPRLRSNYRIKTHLVAMQEAAVEAYRNSLDRDVRTAYFSWLKAARGVEIYEASQALVQENLRVNERLQRANKVTQDAVLRARAEVLTLEQQAAEARKDRDLARSYFNFLLNRPLDADVVSLPADQLPVLYETTRAAVLAPLRPDLAALQAQALQQREELDQLAAARQATGETITLTRAANRPGVSLVLDAGIQGRGYGLTGDHPYYLGSVVLSWNLFSGHQNASRIRQARIDLDRLRTQQQETERQIALQVQQGLDQLLVAEQSLTTAQERLRSAEEGFRLTSRKYEEGLANQITYLDARTTLTNAQLNLNITRYDLFIRLAELAYSVGM
jgi:outer membrane protein TolC